MSSDKERLETSSEDEEPLSNRQRRKMQQQQETAAHDTATSAEPGVEEKAAGAGARSVTGDGWAHDQQPPMEGPCKVQYCPTCDMPFEYCEFSGAACSKQEPIDASTRQQQQEQQLSDDLGQKAVINEGKRASGKGDAREVRFHHVDKHVVLNSGNPVEEKFVTVQKQAKRRGKCATNIWGLEHFDVKPDLVAKAASKHFACGASSQKGQPGQAPFVEIQGDVEDKVVAFLEKQFMIPSEKITFLSEK